MQELILASGSSRRYSLLNRLCLRYSVQVPNVDESIFEEEKPVNYVERMARMKALAVYEKVKDRPILAADTTISFNEEIIGKPKNFQHAMQILQKLSGNNHDVFTALYLKTNESDYPMLVKSTVKFKKLADQEIEAYCLTDEPYDKAGAYAIQGSAARFIEYIEGSYTNIVGLPLSEVAELLQRAKVEFSGNAW